MTPAGPRSLRSGRAVIALAALVAAAVLVTAVAGDLGRAAPSPGPSPSPSPFPSIAAAVSPSPSPSPEASPSPSPDASPSPSPSPSPSGPYRVTAVDGAGAPASRVAVPSMRIDLPVVRPARREPFPLCNVAEYLMPFAVPGMAGVSYLYAHARTGMFLPLLTASKVKNGKAMLGKEVAVWTSDARRYSFRIVAVRPHVSAGSIPAWVYKLPPNSLILQTSETPYSNGTKLFVVASLVGMAPSTEKEARPTPHPLVCA